MQQLRLWRLHVHQRGLPLAGRAARLHEEGHRLHAPTLGGADPQSRAVRTMLQVGRGSYGRSPSCHTRAAG